MKIVALLALVMLLGADPPPSLDVTIHDGTLHGAAAGGMTAFRGIPYAYPPVGELRWQPPRHALPWTGVRDATAYGNYCPQAGTGAFFPAPAYSEDCLYLNVFTTGAAIAGHERRPVMVWIPGGGLYGGSSNDYDMRSLVAAGTVVVSFNYRLGILGFFAHPALDAEHHDLGDYGVMDQQFALQWVQQNIAAFGGDPANVTIFGESAGGISVLAHIVSPASANLFTRAIVESGSTPALIRTFTPLTAAETKGQAFAAAAGCAHQDVACLRALTPQQIVGTEQRFLTGMISGVATLPVPFHEAITSGAFHHVPMLMGNNHDEWRWPIAQAELNTGKPLSIDGYPAALAAFFGAATAPSVLTEYPPAQYGSPSEALGAAETDYYLACTSYELDQWFAPLVPMYAYEFDDRTVPMYMPPVSFPYGAAHTSELQFLFPNFHGGRGAIRPLSPAERQLATRMAGYWTAFARNGDPNAPGRPAWPRFSGKTGFLSLRAPDPAPLTAPAFAAEHHCDFWSTVSAY